MGGEDAVKEKDFQTLEDGIEKALHQMLFDHLDSGKSE